MNEDNIQLNDLDIPNLNEDDSNNQLLDIIDTFEMTTPRPGEDYSTWTLMAASAAAAATVSSERTDERITSAS